MYYHCIPVLSRWRIKTINQQTREGIGNQTRNPPPVCELVDETSFLSNHFPNIRPTLFCSPNTCITPALNFAALEEQQFNNVPANLKLHQLGGFTLQSARATKSREKCTEKCSKKSTDIQFYPKVASVT